MKLDAVRHVNELFKTCSKAKEKRLHDGLMLSMRQEAIYRGYYLSERGVDELAETLNISPRTIHRELASIRRKILATEEAGT